jgi:hypothetical protein
MTKLAPPEAPYDLGEYLRVSPRVHAIDGDGFDLDLRSWNTRMGHLPGAPVRGIAGDAERDRISRGSLFAMANPACEDETNEAAYALFWHTLVWGTETSYRSSRQRTGFVEKDVPGIGRALRRAAVASRTDPETAFRTLQPFRPLIGSLGPNYFTMYLYFAGAGNPEHPCLIVDKRVLATLSRYTDEPLTPKSGTGYGYKTYSAAIGLMSDWARQLSTPERHIGFDEVERWAFNVGT